MEIYAAYREKMSAQLNEWSSQITLLEARIENISADAKVKKAKEIKILRAKQHAISDKLEELGKESGESWEEVKLTADKLWNDLKSGLAKAQSKFQ
jgi:ornithine cyclodeaminase/alanine dehydrogenase-like protein (mu-crystallin family)